MGKSERQVAFTHYAKRLQQGRGAMRKSKPASRILACSILVICFFLCNTPARALDAESQVILGNYSNYLLGNGQQVSGVFQLTPSSGTVKWTDYHFAGASAVAPPGDIWWDYPSQSYPTQQADVYGPRSSAMGFSDAQSMELIATADAFMTHSVGNAAAWVIRGFEIESPIGQAGSILTQVSTDYAAYFKGSSPGSYIPALAKYSVSFEVYDPQGISVMSAGLTDGDEAWQAGPYSFDEFQQGTLSRDGSLLYDTEYTLKMQVGAFAGVPEPSTMLLLGFGLLGLAGTRRRIGQQTSSFKLN